MTNVVEQFGWDRFDGRFRGAFFLDPQNRPSFVTSTNPRQVEYISVEGTYEEHTATNRAADHEFFDTLAKFSVPTLGWRAADKGKLLVYFQRNNTGYGRGTGLHNIGDTFSQLSEALLDDGSINYMNEKQKCVLVFNPGFMTLQEGVQAIRNGEILSFAIKPTIAVYAESDDSMRVLFRNTEVGRIDHRNNINVTIPIIRQQLGELQ